MGARPGKSRKRYQSPRASRDYCRRDGDDPRHVRALRRRGPAQAEGLACEREEAERARLGLSGPLYYGDHTYAWVLRDARRLEKPVRYDHPQGAVIWVSLAPSVGRRIDR